MGSPEISTETKLAVSSGKDTIWYKHGSAVGCPPCIQLRDVPENNDVHGDISWPACLSDLLACNSFLWVHLKRRVFQTRSADWHNLKLRISEERNAMSPVVSAQWKAFKLIHQWISLDGWCVMGVVKNNCCNGPE